MGFVSQARCGMRWVGMAYLVAMSGCAKTPLHRAIEEGNRARIEKYIAARKGLFYHDNLGLTPLHLAALRDDVETISSLLARGVPVDIPQNRGAYGLEPFGGATPLLVAAAAGSEASVRILVDAGARVGVKNAFGDTPLIIGARSGRSSIAQVLVDHGADVNAENTIGLSALMAWAGDGDPVAVERLVASGAPVDNANHQGETALTWAAIKGNLANVRVLLSAGATIDGIDDATWSPVFAAMYYENLDVVRHLLANGAAVRGSERNGREVFASARLQQIWSEELQRRAETSNARTALQQSVALFDRSRELMESEVKDLRLEAVKQGTKAALRTTAVYTVFGLPRGIVDQIKQRAKQEARNHPMGWAYGLDAASYFDYGAPTELPDPSHRSLVASSLERGGGPTEVADGLSELAKAAGMLRAECVRRASCLESSDADNKSHCRE